MPAMCEAAGRAIFGALSLSIITLFVKQKPEQMTNAIGLKKSFILYNLICITDVIVPFFCMASGQEKINSGITAIINGTIPFFVVIFLKLFSKNEKWGMNTYASIALGFTGLLILTIPKASSGSLISITGEIMILISSASFAFSVILLKKLAHQSTVHTVRNIMLTAAIYMSILSLILDKPWLVTFTKQSMFAILFLGVICSAASYIIYIMLIKRVGATFASLANYLVPIVGIFNDKIFLNNILTKKEILAMSVIIIALLINQVNQFRLFK
jgi:drug/metabolite transporter (DMT)-like permease